MKIIIAIAIYKWVLSDDIKDSLATKEGVMMLGSIMIGLVGLALIP